MARRKFNLFFLCIFVVANISSHAQQDFSAGFISIDCGLPPEVGNYNDSGLDYQTDASFIDTGENYNIAPEYIVSSLSRQLQTVRSFHTGARNCYNFTALQGKGIKYLIRATFMYGNYDGQNQATTFDLHLGVELWDTIKVNDSTSVDSKEIIHVPSSNYFYVCLVNLGTGTPFISTLELRPINQTAYPTESSSFSLYTYDRVNFAPAISNQVIRYPLDHFDRIWQPYPVPPDMAPLSTIFNIDVSNSYQPPMAVMQTAMTPLNATQQLKFFWIPTDPTVLFYVYMHFAEVVFLSSTAYREFDVYLLDHLWYNQSVVPSYLSVLTILSQYGVSEVNFNYSLVRTQESTLPPIINALEIYTVKQFLQSQTAESDVETILNIKSTYQVKKDWQGDPCVPLEFTWDGLGCIIYKNKSAPPRIISLNLSSSGLTGAVSPYISNFAFLQTLDLSNNNLSGPVPPFLADLPQLKALNLSGNQFSGPIPQKLLDKVKGGLDLRADGYSFGTPNSPSNNGTPNSPSNNGTPNSCEAGQCQRKKNSKKILVPIVVSVAAILIVLAALVVILMVKRKSGTTKQKVHENLNRTGTPNRRDGFLETRNLRYSYSDILKMTNNFYTVLGHGAFGTVYYGITDGKAVAVKLLSDNSSQGYREFHSEAELLTRVHHRNLTTLVGYCYEGTRMALVYEYMANGNLREHILGNDGNVLSWSQRLQIALDAAQGLDYLHNGCRPPIIHRDIKTPNILLNENLEAKLGDFGLSRAFNDSAVITKVVGTPGYLDPEYYETLRLNEKSDIYSFGIVILELITGRAAINMAEEKPHIYEWVSFRLTRGDIGGIIDPRFKAGMYDINSVWRALELAMACASPRSGNRPAMAHVITELTECLATEKAHIGGQSTDSVELLTLNSRILNSGVFPR